MKKCPVCGSENIYENGSLFYSGSCSVPLNGCTCVDCGYVMFFSPELAQKGRKSLDFNDYLIKKFTLFSEILDKNFPNEYKPDTDKLNSLIAQLSAVTKVICDENQTVKAVKEAQQQKKELEEQIDLERKIINKQNEDLKAITEIKHLFSVDGYKGLLPPRSLPDNYETQDIYEICIKEYLDNFGEQISVITELSELFTIINKLKFDFSRWHSILQDKIRKLRRG